MRRPGKVTMRSRSMPNNAPPSITGNALTRQPSNTTNVIANNYAAKGSGTACGAICSNEKNRERTDHSGTDALQCRFHPAQMSYALVNGHYR